ncbi:NADP-dependent malic enzyme [bacterium]|jgi:malate dehydrogenase (oxaloacetate-decarboxylating)|nr:NADP-dependent malic enzyme [bacterium]MBT6293337.1 NADP-dependent malic enzyme [bacterium]
MNNQNNIEALNYHAQFKGKVGIQPLTIVDTIEDLNLAYTPGIGAPILEIQNDPENAYKYTLKSRSVAVVCNGTATLGLGDTGPLAALPVIEGKSALIKKFANLDAFPLCIEEKDPKAIIKFCKQIEPTFGAILLEDIKAPECFEIERTLIEELNIPVFHDDQHGTAIVVLAGLINSMKILNKKKEELKVVINGAGAAGISIAEQLHSFGIENIVLLDSKGILSKNRTDLNKYKLEALEFTNSENIDGDLKTAIKDSNCFIGVSVANLLDSEDIKLMEKDSIVFALANPVPEIMPTEAVKGGAKIVATGRSDFANQINNILVFPGILKGAVENRVPKITRKMLVNASVNLAAVVENPSVENIVPKAFDNGVIEAVSKAIS